MPLIPMRQTAEVLDAGPTRRDRRAAPGIRGSHVETVPGFAIRAAWFEKGRMIRASFAARQTAPNPER
jgi:hypothetical protein